MFKDTKGGIMVLLTGFILICFWGMYHQETEELTKADFVRFHVVANSNSPEDQELKLAVRDQVLEAVSLEMAELGSASESRGWLEENSDRINDIAKSVIQREGYDYSSTTELGVRWIPEKSYGSIVFPAGNYEAFTIKIGEGAGENWWCVMFPPVCIIGDNPEGSQELAGRFEGTKYEELIGCAAEGSPYKLKFKSAEAGKKFVEWIKS